MDYEMNNTVAAESTQTGKELSEDPKAFEKFIREKKAEGATGYVVETNLSQDDEMDYSLSFLFKEPKPISYDRYVKTSPSSHSKAMRTFVLDNICDEQRKDLDDKLDKWPALGISLGEKLLYMLGLSRTTSVRKL